MPDRPSRQPCQNSDTEFPSGVIAPIPVTTTRVPFLPAMRGTSQPLVSLGRCLSSLEVGPSLRYSEGRACQTYYLFVLGNRQGPIQRFRDAPTSFRGDASLQEGVRYLLR